MNVQFFKGSWLCRPVKLALLTNGISASLQQEARLPRYRRFTGSTETAGGLGSEGFPCRNECGGKAEAEQEREFLIVGGDFSNIRALPKFLLKFYREGRHRRGRRVFGASLSPSTESRNGRSDAPWSERPSERVVPPPPQAVQRVPALQRSPPQRAMRHLESFCKSNKRNGLIKWYKESQRSSVRTDVEGNFWFIVSFWLIWHCDFFTFFENKFFPPSAVLYK